MSTDKTKALAVRLPALLAERIKDMADREGVTVSEVIKALLSKALSS